MKKLKALIIDDSITIRKIIRANLNKLGINEVFEAANADEGFKAAKATRLDVAFIDYNMPGGMTGLDLAEKIRGDAKISSIKLVAVSSEFDEALMDRFKEFGVTDFIEKPFDLGKFNAAIMPIIETKAGEKEEGESIASPGGAKLTKDMLNRLFATTPTITIDDKYMAFVFGNERVTIPSDAFISNSFHFIDIPTE